MDGLAKLFTQNIVWRSLHYFLNFVLTVAIARHFEAVASGGIYYLMSNCALIILLLSFSLESAIVFFSSENRIKISKLFHLSVLWILGIIVLIFIVAGFIRLFFADYPFIFRNADSIVFIIGTITTTFMTSFFYAEKKFVAPNLISIVITLLLIAALLCINENGWLTGKRFISIYLGSFLLQGIILWILLFKNHKEFRFFSLLTESEYSKLFKYLSLVFFSNVISFLCYRTDYWFVNYFCPGQALGNYIQVSKLVQLFFVFPGILATVVFPVTSGGEAAKIKAIIPAITRITLVVYSFVCIGLIITGQWLFPFVFGKTFSLMYASFLCYIPGIIGFSALFVFTSFYSGRDMVMVNVKGCLLALAITVTGDFIFIPRYGINAAAAVSSCAYVSYFIFVVRVFIKEFNVSVKELWVLRKEDIHYIKNFLFNKTNR